MSIEPTKATNEDLEKVKKEIESDSNLDKDWLAYREAEVKNNKKPE